MITNLSDVKTIGSATTKEGEFLTFDGLSNNRFSLIIPLLPHVEFFLQTFSLPSVSVGEVSVPTRFVDYNGIGEKLVYSPFSVSFIVDKYARNYASVIDWMKSMTVNGSTVDKETDVVLMLDGKEFLRFYGAWPAQLSGLDLDSTAKEFTYVKAQVTFNYDFFAYIGQFATVDSDYNHPENYI